jgi:hypothetical protein
MFFWLSLTHFVALCPCCCQPCPPPQHVSNVRVAWRNSLARWPFLVPLATRQGLIGNVTIDGHGIANNLLLPMGDCPNTMTCAISCLCPHWCHAKVNGLGGFLLAGCLALLCGGGGRRCWCCSQFIARCGHRLSQSRGLILLLLCPCGGGRHHGGEGRGHDDDLDLFFVVWYPRNIFETTWTIMPTLFLGLTFSITNNDNTKNNSAKDGMEELGNGEQAQHMT